MAVNDQHERSQRAHRTETIKQKALKLGFEKVGVVCAEALADESDHLREWLRRGYHGEMAYLARNADKRMDPQLVLAQAKSIITLAVNYGKEVSSFARQVPSSQPALLSGVIARYARFTDYHQVMGPRLKELAEFVDRLGGAATRSLWYVDTGPILERDLAQRAGLGFIGKHTNLISRQLGNWILLAEILTTLELAPDAPEQNRCGSCTRCLAACPSGAITAPFQLDARRCISYLTI